MKNNHSQAPAFLTDHLDTWTSAIKAKSSAGRGNSKKQEFYGIKKLRELILELAVRGLLVPQDPNDEPAGELLKKVGLEKVENIEQAGLQRQKNLPLISQEEKLFNLPIGWEWARLDELGITHIGLTYSPKEISERNGIPVLRSSNVQEGKICMTDLIRVEKQVHQKFHVVKNDLLICARNGSSRLVGKCAIIEEVSEPMTFGAFMAIFRSSLNPYIKHFLESPVFRGKLVGVETTTINQLTQNNLRSTTIPLPPLAEQHRIVAKVDELMTLCDQLEQQQEDSVQTHSTLVKTLLGALTAASDHAQFQQAWQRIASHFDTLFTTENSIDQLKQTILQLAVMGKLVEQNPEDEPAEELYSRIAKIKESLIREKFIKRVKVEPNPINEESIELPRGWLWTRLGNAFDVRDGTHDTPKYTNKGFPLVTSKNIYTGKLVFDDANFISEEDHKKICERSKVDKGDILFAMIGSIGNPTIVDTEKEFSIKNVALFKYFSTNDADPRFLLLYLTQVAEEMKAQSAGGVQSFVSLGFLRNYLFPLPPLAEQHRIVAKVDEMMSLCDRLKTRLQSAQATQLHLADTLVEAAIR